MSGPGLDLAGKHGRTTMIRKKWHDGEPGLSVETEGEFWKALTTGETVELTWELGEQIGLMEDGTITVAEAPRGTTQATGVPLSELLRRAMAICLCG